MSVLLIILAGVPTTTLGIPPKPSPGIPPFSSGVLRKDLLKIPSGILLRIRKEIPLRIATGIFPKNPPLILPTTPPIAYSSMVSAKNSFHGFLHEFLSLISLRSPPGVFFLRISSETLPRIALGTLARIPPRIRSRILTEILP